MIKVLLVSPSFPFPEYKNGLAKVNYNILSHQNGYKADLLTINDSEFSNIPNVNTYLVPFVKRFSKKNLLLKWLTSLDPINVIKYSPYLDEIVKNIEKHHHLYDIVHVSSPFFASIFLKVSKHVQSKMIIFPIDSVSLNIERRLPKEKNILRKLFLYIELLKYRRFESIYYAQYRNVCFVSNIDETYVLKLNKKINTITIPNGVDIEYFKKRNYIAEENYSMVFTGDMSYAPNEDAMLFFIKHVYPIISKRLAVKLYIVGKNPTEKLRKLASENIIITGFVEDIREYLDKATIYISPLRFGSGIKNKILEAMAMSKIVLGTAVSFDGIEVKNFENCILMAENSFDMADKILKVLYNIEGFKYIEKNARKLIENYYSWDGITKRYCDHYRKIAKNMD